VPRRHTPTGLCGILLIDKPAEMTSHDIVDSVRRITGEKRVGHAGTLDPMATGLMLILVGPAARLSPYLSVATKTYEASVVFGSATDTDDATGKTLHTCPVPPSAADKAFADKTVAALIGEAEQVPPQYSAIKKNGVTAYTMARKGEAVVMESRTISVFEAELLAIQPGPPVAWDLRMTVSKGTYIRSIARDLGETIGSCAHLGGLRRLKCAHLDVDEALKIEDLPREPEALARLFFDPVDALGLPVVQVDKHTAEKISSGRRLPIASIGSDIKAQERYVVLHDGRVLAIYSVSEEEFVPLTVMPPDTKFGTRR